MNLPKTDRENIRKMRAEWALVSLMEVNAKLKQLERIKRDLLVTIIKKQNSSRMFISPAGMKILVG